VDSAQWFLVVSVVSLVVVSVLVTLIAILFSQ
jgi:hypothetical protein